MSVALKRQLFAPLDVRHFAGSRFIFLAWATCCTVISTGCASATSTNAGRGALFGGAVGTGVGALIGEATGNPLAGAALGAGVGALTGAAVGSSVDEQEARNQAQMQASYHQSVPGSGVTFEDVMTMSRAGVDDSIIINQVRSHGIARPLQTSDVIAMQQNRVSSRVIQALQAAPVGGSPVVYQTAGMPLPSGPPPGPPPVIIQESVVVGGGPYWRRRCGPWGPYGCGPRVGWGVSFGSGWR